MATTDEKVNAAYDTIGDDLPVSTKPTSPPPPPAPQPVLTVQPGSPQQQQQQPLLMSRPAAMPGVPPGLEYLTQIDQLLVHQQIELIEILVGWEVCNKYVLRNSLGQQVYFAGEESGLCMRQFCGPARGFIMHITDNFGQEVIRLIRDFKCCAGWGCCAGAECCSMDVRVEAPAGQLVGYVRQTESCWVVKYSVNNEHDESVFTIDGPCCPIQGVCCQNDIEFPLVSAGEDRHQVGSIGKQWGGVLREAFTTADNFSMSFPLDLDVRMKATLIGALFLVDYMFFEHKK